MCEANLNFVLLLTCVMCLVNVRQVKSYVLMVFSSDNFQGTIRFNASNFNSLFDCMLTKSVRCKADYQYIYSLMQLHVTAVKWSSNRDEAAYMCKVYDTNMWSGYILCYTRVNQCQLFNTCTTFQDGVFILNYNVYLAGNNIESCVTSCSGQTFYHITTSSTSVTPITTTSSKTIRTSLNTVRTTSLNTVTTTHSTNTPMTDKPSINLSSSTLIGVVAAGAVFLLLCFSFVFLCWRKRKSRIDQSHSRLSSNTIRLTEKSVYVNNTILTTGKQNQVGSSLDQSRVETIEQVYAKTTRETEGDYSSCGVEDGYTTKTTRETERDYSSCGLEDGYIDVEQRQDCVYTTIENGADNSDRSRSHSLKCDNADYNNILIKNVVHQDKTTVTNTNVNSCGDTSSDVDYYNIVKIPGSEYQRLGQEKREFLNPYDSFLETGHYKELSPYSLTEPVLGEATLQVIDVGAWADNSSDTERTSKHYHNQKGSNNDDSLYHEPMCDIDMNILGYALINKRDEQ